ncbi:APC membrane recruitment protein 3 [Hyperolius riggenbachi]|uniref:APC membrane recruitment protein 3 n=1 Tax=Hyperolius riggenbachi TaxID=752182 RepID=UPI0035A35D94
MELIRGKTFIISYAQKPSEKSALLGSKVKKKAEAQKNPGACSTKKNVSGTQRMSNGICTKAAVNNVPCPKLIKKSKTSDCVSREEKPEKAPSGRGRLPSSVSSPGLIEDPGDKRNSLQATRSSASKQTMIDYRNFVPQLPFVPSVAKSLPRKRISLRKSKKSLKNIFNLKRNKQQDTISEDESLQTVNVETKGEKISPKESPSNTGDMCSNELLAPELPECEMYTDAISSFKALCEDVASLKSFDSFTGCGEIYADECSSFIDIENCRVTFISKPSPITACFQGGGERLASPAKSESIDFSRLHGHVKSLPRNVCANGMFDTKATPESNEHVRNEVNNVVPGDQISVSTYNDLTSSSENINEPESPKSTSDEGYYDSYSPGVDDNKSELEAHRPFPRDSYSGDALYEFFCDSGETKQWPSQDCVLPSSGHTAERPSSIYSFCVGSEETMASQPPSDLAGEGALQSTWKGRECLLKLCDTELTLSMGMVNWLKRAGKITDSEFNDQTLTCQQTEAMNESSIGNDSTAIQTSLSRRNGKGYKLHRGYKEKEYCSIISRIRDSENILADILSDNTTEKQVTSPLGPSESSSKNIHPFEEHLDREHSVADSGNNIVKNTKCQDNKSSSQHHSSLPPTESTLKDNGTNLPSLHDPLDALDSSGLHYVTNSTSENKCLVEILDKFTARLSSLHITLGHQNALHYTGKVMQPYEIAENIKNVMEHHDFEPQPSSLQPALLSRCDNDIDKIHLKISNEPLLSNTPSRNDSEDECTSDNQLPKDAQSTKTAGKTDFLPLFKPPCSSVISRFSSALYRVHKPGDAVIFFNTGKYNRSSDYNEGFTHDSNNLSIDFPKFRKDAFNAISSTQEAGERDLLLTKNGKWSM